MSEQATVVQIAKQFHDAYERMAPFFGYSTRLDTREWSEASPNGQLMQAVVAEVIMPMLDAERQRADAAERQRLEANLDCGHSASLLVKSVESDYCYCALCETSSRLRDALQAEATYKECFESSQQKLQLAREIASHAPHDSSCAKLALAKYSCNCFKGELLAAIANEEPRTAHMSAEAVVPPPSPAPLPENISRCWQYFGYHVYGASPCFDTLEQAIRYKAELDAEGVTWKPQ